MNVTIDKLISSNRVFAGQPDRRAALACLRAMDPACETSHLRCNFAGLVDLSANPEAVTNCGVVLQELGRAAWPSLGAGHSTAMV